ncbi:MAG: glycosyltransferase family 4 protein [Opitutales bacterium]|nr:glycosyltransferase family 4 protein [Opitutales bacterium]
MEFEQPEIILLTHEFYPLQGGISTFCQELALSLRRRDCEVEIWGPSVAKLPEPLARFGCHLCSLPIPADHGFQATLGMAKALRRNLPRKRNTVVVIAEPGPLRAYFLAFRNTPSPDHRLWIILHGSEILRGRKNPLWKWPLQFCLTRATLVGTVSAFNRELIQSHFPGCGEKVRVLPMGPSSEIREAASTYARAEQKKKPPWQILTVARIHPRKGQDLVLRALALLPAEIRQDVVYRIVGGGRRKSYLRKIKNLAQKSGVRVQFTGPLDEKALWEEYARADFFIMTSRQYRRSVEGFGLVYLEAGCFGLPSIAARSGGVADAVLDGQTGVLVEEGKVMDIRDALERFCTDSRFRLDLGRGAREYSMKRTWDSVAAQFLESTLPGM